MDNSPSNSDVDSKPEASQEQLEGLSESERNAYYKSRGRPAEAPTTVDPEATGSLWEAPDFVPEKFRRESVEDTLKALADSYGHLEKKVGSKEPAPDPVLDLKIEKDESTPAAAPEGIDWNKMMAEGITDEYRQVLQDQYKIPQSVISRFEQDAERARELQVFKAAEIVGGRDNLRTIIDGAKSKYSEAELAEINGVFASGSERAIRGVLRDLQTEFLTATPEPAKAPTNNMLQPTTASGGESSLKPFSSPSEMTAAMRDPRYVTSEKYIAEVTERMRLTKAQA